MYDIVAATVPFVFAASVITLAEIARHAQAVLVVLHSVK